MTVSQESAGTTPSRRTFVSAVGAVGLTAALTACGGSDEPEKPEASKESGGQGAALASTADIPVGGGTIFKDEGVVVTQPEEGQFKAFSNICTHRQCPVASVSDGTINCTCHGSKYAIADGSVKNPPATKPLPPKKIAVKGDEIRLA